MTKAEHPMALHLLIDASGSMGSTVASTVKAVNEFITQMQRVAMPPLLTITTFGMRGKDLGRDLPAYKFPPISTRDYVVGGGTPLVRCTNEAIDRLTRTDALKKVIVIVSDGGDNNGTHQPALRAKIDTLRRVGWTFVYLADERYQLAKEMATGLGFEQGKDVFYYDATDLTPTMLKAADLVIDAAVA